MAFLVLLKFCTDAARRELWRPALHFPNPCKAHGACPHWETQIDGPGSSWLVSCGDPSPWVVSHWAGVDSSPAPAKGKALSTCPTLTHVHLTPRTQDTLGV